MFSVPLIDKPKSSNDHWDSYCFHFPRFLDFNLKIFVLCKFFNCFQGGVPFCGDKHIHKQAGSFFLVFHHYVWSVCFYLFVSLDWHVPEYTHCLVFCHINWFMFVVFILYFDVIVFADCPVEICCSFIVSLYVLCLGTFRASRDSGGSVAQRLGRLP